MLVASELLANAICWTIAGILFGRSRETQPILSLALLAWVSSQLRPNLSLLTMDVRRWDYDTVFRFSTSSLPIS